MSHEQIAYDLEYLHEWYRREAEAGVYIGPNNKVALHPALFAALLDIAESSESERHTDTISKSDDNAV